MRRAQRQRLNGERKKQKSNPSLDDGCPEGIFNIRAFVKFHWPISAVALFLRSETKAPPPIHKNTDSYRAMHTHYTHHFEALPAVFFLTRCVAQLGNSRAVFGNSRSAPNRSVFPSKLQQPRTSLVAYLRGRDEQLWSQKR
jgi:hypothetical protein